MKKLSETYKELGIEFTFPIKIRDANGKLTYEEESNGYPRRWERDSKGNETYYEVSDDWWEKWERDNNYNVVYYENSEGIKRGPPRSTTN